MKNLFATFSVLALLAIPAQGAFAWTYDGLGSLNPFTMFGTRTACGCEKPKLTKCEKLHGVKIKKVKGEPCGCAAPVREYVKIVPAGHGGCTDCQRAF